jgi:thiol-disulfide isomerase/thioredoxin
MVYSRRLLLAIPVLVALAVAVFFVSRDDADAGTPRAALVDTPAFGDVSTGIRKGQLARDFTAGTVDGEDVRLSDLRGRPVIVNFWATWCPSCLEEMPDLKELQAEIGADNLQVIAMNSGEGRDDAKGFLDTLGAPDFIAALDPTLAVTDAYGVIGLSSSVFVDKDGVIRAVYTGQLSKDLMREFAAAASEGYDAADPPPILRLPGSVEARERIFTVDERGAGRIEYASKSLRCDDFYCADGLLETLTSQRGVTGVERVHGSDPPRVTVAFEPQVIGASALTATLVSLLDGYEDALYPGALQVRED